MNKDKVQELLIGAVVVVLGYALYKHFQPAPVATQPRASTTPQTGPGVGGFNTIPRYEAPQQQQWQPFDDKSPYTTIYDPYQGTVDTGAFEGHNYLASLEAAQSPYLNMGPNVGAPARTGGFVY